jgi:hypothetical protein
MSSAACSEWSRFALSRRPLPMLELLIDTPQRAAYSSKEPYHNTPDIAIYANPK